MILLNKFHKEDGTVIDLDEFVRGEWLSKWERQNVLDEITTLHDKWDSRGEFGDAIQLLADWIRSPEMLEDVLCCLAKDLALLVDNYESNYNISSWDSKLQAELYETLGYENYRNRVIARKAFIGLNIKACPYCGSQYLLPFRTYKGKKKFSAQLDHYYPHSKYAFLSISFYNLIPVCSTCNQNKSASKTEDYINPFMHDYDELCRFRVDTVSSAVKHKLYIYYVMNMSTSIADSKSCKSHNEKRGIRELYEDNHQDYIEELYWKAKAYSPSYKEQLKKLLEITDSDIERFLVGNYTRKEDLLKRPLAKLTKDLAKQLGVIK